jgi:hypothetical protein
MECLRPGHAEIRLVGWFWCQELLPCALQMDMNKIGFQMSPEEVFKATKDLNYFPVNSLTWEPNMVDKIRATQAQDMFKVKARAGGHDCDCMASWMSAASPWGRKHKPLSDFVTATGAGSADAQSACHKTSGQVVKPGGCCGEVQSCWMAHRTAAGPRSCLVVLQLYACMSPL